jgi:hypothetical protein
MGNDSETVFNEFKDKDDIVAAAGESATADGEDISLIKGHVIRDFVFLLFILVDKYDDFN